MGRVLRVSSRAPFVVALAALCLTGTLSASPSHGAVFTSPVSFAIQPLTLNEAFVPVAGDFDGDGRDDVLLYGFGEVSDIVLWGRGDHRFDITTATIDETGLRPVAGDFDGDGSDDVFFHGPGPGLPDFVLFGATDRTLTRVATPPIDDPAPFSLTAGDYDGDGLAEIILLGRAPGTDAIWEGTSGRTFGTRPLFPQVAFVRVRVTSGDFDGDARDDVFFYGVGAAPDFIWRGRADGSFLLTGTPAVAREDYRIRAGDFDGSGLDDVFFYGLRGAPEHFRIATGSGGLQVQLMQRRIRSAVARIAVGDFDGDGASDLFVHNPGIAGDSVWFTDPTGSKPASEHHVTENLAYFIESYEGFSPVPYEDPGGNCTIGFGRLLHMGNCTPADWQVTTREAEHQWVLENTDRGYADPVRDLGDVILTQAQFDALVSVAYGGPYGRVFRFVIEPLQQIPPDYAGVVEHLQDRSVHLIGGVFYCGMWRRRLDEAEMFQTGNYLRDYRSCPARASRGEVPPSPALFGGRS